MKLPLLVACAVVLGALVASAALGERPVGTPGEGEDEDLATSSVRTSGRMGPESRLAPLNAPSWQVGDAWLVQFDEGDPVCWFVVVSANASGYTHGLWCPDEDETREIAAQIAGFDQPHFGEFTLELSGRSAEGAVRYFDWPLSDGKSWSTMYGGAEATVQARADGATGRYLLAITADGDVRVEYDYNPQLRWWSRMEFASGYVFAVHDRETGWDLGATYGVAEERFSFRRSAAEQLPLRPVFEVPDTDDMLVLMADRAGAFVHRFAFLDPDGDTAWESTSTSNSNFPSGVGCFSSNCWNIVESEAGIWSLDDQYASAGEAVYRAIGVDLRTL